LRKFQIPSLIIAESCYHILDVDTTQYFSGSFDEEELISVLGSFDPEFKLQKSFSNSCVVISSPASRIKVYNKVACNLKSPGVSTPFEVIFLAILIVVMRSLGNHSKRQLKRD